MSLPSLRSPGVGPRGPILRGRPHTPVLLGLLVLPGVLALAGCRDSPTGPPAGAVAVLSVTPEILRPGQEAVLDGQNFAGTPEGNEVLIHGDRVTVLEASSTRLRVRLPDFLCAPEGEVPIVVRVGGDNGAESEPFLRAFEPVGVLDLAPGQYHLASFPEDLCMIVGASSAEAEYLVGTQSISETPATLTGVTVHGRVPGPPGTVAAVAAGMRSSGIHRSLGPGASSGLRPWSGASAASPEDGPAGGADRWIRHRAAETLLRTDERRLVDRILRAPVARSLAAAPRSPRVPGNVQPGDVVELRVPDVSDEGNSCTDGRPIEAIVRRVGSRSIWVEDTDNPSGGFTGGDYELLSDEFDSEIYDEVVSYFGQPTDLDGNDRIVIVVSHEVNRMTRALAFVALSDFFPDQCPGANGGEYYYARAPDPQGSVPGPDGDDGPAYTRSAALSDAPRLLAHEVTHIVQFGRRLQLPNPDGIFQAIWLLEGQATFAEEVVGHRYTGAQPRANLGAMTALEGDFPPTGVGWYQVPFFDLAVYYGFDAENGAPEECSWLSVEDPEPCVSGRIAYGVTWSFLRWMADHFHDRFGGGEREFQRRIVDSPAWGFAVFGDVLGEDPTELLAPWAAALYTDRRVSGDPLLSFPSWDLRDIEGRLVEEARLTPDGYSFENFSATVQVAAASSYYQLVRAQAGHPSFALAARSPADGTLPDHMQLWVARIR
jgi:hypothetical protein